MLVVHSGKTTIGLFASLRIVSRDVYVTCWVDVDGTAPVADIIDNRDTSLNPITLERGAGVRVEGEEIAAEPVPVRLPGVMVIGFAFLLEAVLSVLTGSQTGETNTGSNLVQGIRLNNVLITKVHYNLPESKPKQLNPGSPVRDNDVPSLGLPRFAAFGVAPNIMTCSA